MNHPWFGETPFRTASSFSSPLFIDNFIRGKGGKWMDYERWFIERLQKQTDSPIRARRVPCEADAWADHDPSTPDHPFFGNRDTADLFWNYNALASGQRPGLDKSQPALTVHMQKYLLIQIKLAREFDMKTEFVIDWTLKHANQTIGWGTIGHCIRQTAAFLRLVDVGEWDQGVDGNAIGHPTNKKANDRVHEMFDEVKGPIADLIAFELHNEVGAHDQASWAKAGMDEAKAISEVNKQLERTKRFKDGQAEQWPEGACWVSHGGRDTILYDPQFADAVAIHPSRPSTRVGDRFHHLRKYGKPVYANEIYHYIPRDLWWTVEQGWFREGSSTANVKERARFVDEMLDDGMWVCEHGLTNMSNGRWKDADQDFSEMPLDPYEKARGARAGITVPPPDSEPDPEPDPEPPEEEEMNVHYGRNFVLVKLPEPIVVDVDEDGDEAFQKTYLLKLNKVVEVIAIDSFAGHDRGDAYEFSVETFSDIDPAKVEHARDFLWRRIDEDTAPNNDEHRLSKLARPVSLKALKIHLLCRVTGKNELVEPEHLSYKKWRGVFDFNMMLITR